MFCVWSDGVLVLVLVLHFNATRLDIFEFIFIPCTMFILDVMGYHE